MSKLFILNKKKWDEFIQRLTEPAKIIPKLKKLFQESELKKNKS